MLKQITPNQSEAILNWALDHADDERPIVTTTEAPHYRRLAVMRHATRIEHPPQGQMIRRSMGIRDGNGVMFISHTGEVQPSGFLPLTAGNVSYLNRVAEQLTGWPREEATGRPLAEVFKIIDGMTREPSGNSAGSGNREIVNNPCRRPSNNKFRSRL